MITELLKHLVAFVQHEMLYLAQIESLLLVCSHGEETTSSCDHDMRHRLLDLIPMLLDGFTTCGPQYHIFCDVAMMRWH